MRIRTFIAVLAASIFTMLVNNNLYAQVKDVYPTPKQYDVATFYWPAYHPDSRFKDIGVFPDGKGE